MNRMEFYENEVKYLNLLKSDYIVQIYDNRFNTIELEEYKTDLCRYFLEDDEDPKKSFVRMAECLEFVHSKGVIHRDIKISNYLISFEGKIVLCDLESCTEKEGEDSTEYTTHLYASDEAFEKCYYFSSDIYSLGVAFYLLITGDFKKAKLIKRNEIPGKIGKLEGELGDFIRKMTHKDRNKRPSIDEVVETMKILCK